MRINQFSKISAAMLLAVGLSACANSSDDEITNSSTLTAYHWNMSQAVDASGNSDAQWLRAESTTPATLRFSEDRLGVSGLCNAMGAGYTVKGSAIDIAPLVSTMMMCADEDLMRYEQHFGQRLAEASTWQVNESAEEPSLTLSFNNGAAWTLKGIPTAETKYGSTGETVFLEVAAETKPCTHPLIDDFQCLQVRTVNYDEQGIKQGHGEWQHFYDSIENYEHTPGVRNVLRLKRYENKNAPADSSSYAYVLDMIVETEQL